ncbi:hypothetical protein DAEQUDRAFT_769005 [Daedalea quercina L-15889]|uniref:Uncharacterized protein n=1 Tax=Daedalea quercina L-15889 TaxID=1314783 RepID=A0A165M580_9APHY|nr:hypothetical protein DAEQUDRAFT_769005 [Daedalea quercina L-15889]
MAYMILPIMLWYFVLNSSVAVSVLLSNFHIVLLVNKELACRMLLTYSKT